MLKDAKVVQMVQKLAETGSAKDAYEVMFVSQVNHTYHTNYMY